MIELSKSEQLRSRVIAEVRNYYRETQTPAPFEPGTTYIPVTCKTLNEDDLVALTDASLDLWLTAGRFARRFEKELSKQCGRNAHALFVNSGSSANLLALSSLGSPLMKKEEFGRLAKGSEIITVAAGFPTTVNPIVQNGWIPVFVDVDPITLNATLESIQQARSDKTRGVILAHTLGNPFQADTIAQWCAQEGLYLIEDCCDALGATILTAKGEQPVGSFGHYATMSFYPAHQITTGEGGALIPRSHSLRRVAEGIRDWGRDCWCEPGKDNTCGRRFDWQLGSLPFGYDHKYVYSSLGYNLKATDMQAALGCSQLSRLPEFVAIRRQNWEFLHDGIKNSPVLKSHLIPMAATAGTNPSWFGFALSCVPDLKREKLVRFLEDRKVGTRLLFAGNITKQPAYSDVEFRTEGDLPVTEDILQHMFWIGVHPGLKEPQLVYMLEQLELGVKAQL